VITVIILCGTVHKHMAWLKMLPASVQPLSFRICQPRCTCDYYVHHRCFSESTRSYYDVLGVKPNASQSQIKTAYYHLSKVYHPDTAKELPNAEEKFATLSTAYEVLGNPHKRALYDRKHGPGASFSPDSEYSDFLRRRGSFTPRAGAYGTSTKTQGSEFDAFYSQQYANVLRRNWEFRKTQHHRPAHQRMQEHEIPENLNFAVLSLCATVGFMATYFFLK